MKRLTFTGWFLLAAVALSLIAATVGVVKKVSDYPSVTTPGTNDLFLLSVPNPTNQLFGAGSTNKNVKYKDLKSSINASNQPASANLSNWSALATSAKQDALGYTPQPASTNLTNWSALATSAKQDALGYTPQPASTNLTNWSALATSAKQDALGYTPQPASTNLTNWSALATSAKQDALGYTPQPASTNLTNWSALATSAKQDALGYTPQPASTNLTNWSAMATSAKQDAQLPWTTLALTGTNAAAIDLAAGSMFKLTLTNNAFFPAPTGPPGTNLSQTIQVHLIQDGTGGRKVTLTNSAWVLSGSGASTNAVPTINTNANGVTILTFASSPFDATKLYGVPSAFTP